MKRCLFTGRVPLENQVCNQCKLFLSTCFPVAAFDGRVIGGECDFYLCDACEKACGCFS